MPKGVCKLSVKSEFRLLVKSALKDRMRDLDRSIAEASKDKTPEQMVSAWKRNREYLSELVDELDCGCV